MKVGLIGYRGVGKTTVFAALSGLEPAAGSGGRRAVVDVVDRRLDHLRDVYRPRRFVRARFDIEESPPLPSADTRGRGEVIAELRAPDALLAVVGCFEMARMTLDERLRDPHAQLGALREELLLLDMEAIETRLDRLRERYQRGGGDRIQMDREIANLERFLAQLEMEGPFPEPADGDQVRLLDELHLFAQKPIVAVFNVDERGVADAAADIDLDDVDGPATVMCAPIEHEIALIDDDGERRAFAEEYGLSAPAAERLTRLAYDALDLISFFTVGDDEVRAWPLRRGSDAVTAAGKIHTDLARGFIRAEVTPYEPVAAATTPAEVKAVGAARLEGKDYVVQDGDIINIRFSV